MQQNDDSMVPVQYVGKKPTKTDTTFGTGTVWDGPGAVQLVPKEIAHKMALKHPDIWRRAEPLTQPPPAAPGASTGLTGAALLGKQPAAAKGSVATLVEVIRVIGEMFQREDLANHLDDNGIVKQASVEQLLGKRVPPEFLEQAMQQIDLAAPPAKPAAK